VDGVRREDPGGRRHVPRRLGVLRAQADHYRKVADTYRDLVAAKDRGDFGDSPQTRSLRIAAEAAVRVNDALAQWATWAREGTST